VPGVSARARPVSRRTAVGAALAGTLAGSGLVAGCSLDPPDDDSPAGSGAGSPDGSGAGSTVEPEPDADVVLLGSVLASLDDTAAIAAATVDRHPRLAATLQPLVDVHALHRAVLDEAAEVDQDAAATPAVPPRAAVALDRVRRAETRLADTLREATVTAQSGDFARALASMTASLSQHLAVLGDATATA
jgi:hypothetical protein